MTMKTPATPAGAVPDLLLEDAALASIGIG